MLRNDSRNINIQSTSIINGNEVASFSTSVSSDGSGGQLYQNIIDNKLYLDNINDVTADRMAFQDEALKEQVSLMQAVRASTERTNAEIKAITEPEAEPEVASEETTEADTINGTGV